MFNMHLPATNRLGNLTIFTPMFCRGGNLLTRGGRNVIHRAVSYLCKQWFTTALAQKCIRARFTQGDSTVFLSQHVQLLLLR